MLIKLSIFSVIGWMTGSGALRNGVVGHWKWKPQCSVLLAWANIFRFQWPRRRSSFMGCCALRQLKWHFWVRSPQSNSSVDVIQIVHWWCGHIPELCSKRTALNYEFCPFCYERQNGSINQYVCCKCNVTIIGLRFIDKINNLLASLSKLSIIPHTGYSTKLKQLQFYTT